MCSVRYAVCTMIIGVLCAVLCFLCVSVLFIFFFVCYAKFYDKIGKMFSCMSIVELPKNIFSQLSRSMTPNRINNSQMHFNALCVCFGGYFSHHELHHPNCVLFFLGGSPLIFIYLVLHVTDNFVYFRLIFWLFLFWYCYCFFQVFLLVFSSRCCSFYKIKN